LRDERLATGGNLSDKFHPVNGFEYLYTRAVLDLYEGHLRLIVEEARAGGDSETILPGLELPGGRAIEFSEDCMLVMISWNEYVAYVVVDETYAPIDRMDDEFLNEGKWMRNYSSSGFLRYVEQATFATIAHDIELKHFRLRTLNHLIDVVAKDSPLIQELERNDGSFDTVIRTFPGQN
jgi:hypothetical protein